MKTALIVGASGLIGKECLYRLFKENEYIRVIALVRKPLAIKHHKLEQVIVDFDKLEEYSGQMMADDVFCCLGTTIKVAGTRENFRKVDFDYPLKTAEICLRNNAKQFLLVSAMGANKHSRIWYNTVKGEVEEAIGQLHYPSFYIFRPSLLLGNRAEFRLKEVIPIILMKGLAWLFIGPLKKYRAIKGATVAAKMVKVAVYEQQKGTVVYENDKILEE